MHKKKISACLLGGILAFWFSVTACGCLVSGWDLITTNPQLLILWCGIFAVLMPVLLYFRHGIWILILLSVRGGFALWQEGELWRQIQSIAYRISYHFHDVYGWSVIGEDSSESCELAMILLAYVTALCVSICICRNRSVSLALLPVFAALTLCLITTDTLPDEPVLLLLILGAALMFLTDWVRRNRPENFAGLFFTMLIPSAALLGILFHFVPQEGYVNRAAELQKALVQLGENVKSTAESVIRGSMAGNSGLESVNLKNTGPRKDFSFTVMRLTSPYDGVVYLRGRDYDIYTGYAWESSEERHEIFTSGEMSYAGEENTLKVVTYGVRSVRYVPYYSAKPVELIAGYAENQENSVSYHYNISRIGKENSGSSIGESDYLKLPKETRKWAREIVENLLNGKRTAGDREIANKIGAYVRQSADYDLNTSVMSGAYNDFAQWFLEESETGYCVHFATSAAVLLRAAGIPARYVEGYMVSCSAGEKTLVTNHCAHAWVEYYDSGDLVWKILEATPAEALVTTESVPDEPEETEETEEAEETAETEAETTPPAETDKPDESETPTSGPNENLQQSGSGSGSAGTSSGNRTDSGTGTSSGTSGKPSGGTVNQNNAEIPEEKFTFVIPEWLKKLGWILLYVLLAAGAVVGQRELRLMYRRKKWFRGTPNKMALERRRQLVFMARRIGVRYPAELEALAMKARFSQHTLTSEELYRFEQFRTQILTTADGLPWYRKIWLRWILAIL